MVSKAPERRGVGGVARVCLCACVCVGVQGVGVGVYVGVCVCVCAYLCCMHISVGLGVKGQQYCHLGHSNDCMYACNCGALMLENQVYLQIRAHTHQRGDVRSAI